MSEPEAHGPIDFLIIQFPIDSTGAESAKALAQILDSGAVRLYDLMVVRKDGSGVVAEIDLEDTSDGQLDEWTIFAGARSGLLSTDDLPDASRVLDANSVGVVVVFENAWAIPFVAAARAEGAEMVASARLSAQEIMDAIDAADAVA
jgi:hypothetical protein